MHTSLATASDTLSTTVYVAATVTVVNKRTAEVRVDKYSGNARAVADQMLEAYVSQPVENSNSWTAVMHLLKRGSLLEVASVVITDVLLTQSI